MLDSISGLLALGGPVVAILATISVFALALVLVKLFQFHRERVGRHRVPREALHAWLHRERARGQAMVDADASAVSAALSTAMRLTAVRDLPQAAIEQEVARGAQQRLHDLQRGFRALDAIAQVAPLLGLFGTVLGMIEAFRQLQAAGSAVDPSLLAGGIWVALLTTAVGLAVAMPTQLILTWFETQVENERVAIETMASTVIAHARNGAAASLAYAAADAQQAPARGEAYAH